MELVTANVENDTLVLQPHGRVDSSNAAEFERAVFALREANPGKKTILDGDDLPYISSAGLRVLLKLLKADRGFKIVSAGSELYEVLEMTGFTEMMPVEKGYRKLSVEGCEVIGRGANGEVYRLDPDTIIKVYHNPDSLPDIHRERELARRAFVLGVPTAIPYDVVRVGEGYGSVFELLNARSFAQILKAEPERAEEITQMKVELLKTIHGTEVLPEDMPDMRETVLNWVGFLKEYLPAEKWEKLHALVEAVPVNHHMIHGDYHVKNVMLQNGEALLIDMDTLAQGDPVFEFASVFNAYCGFSILDPDTSSRFLGLPVGLPGKVFERTLELYFGTNDPEALRKLVDKMSLIGYTRLLRRHIRRNDITQGEGKAYYDAYRSAILELLDRVETLDLFAQ